MTVLRVHTVCICAVLSDFTIHFRKSDKKMVGWGYCPTIDLGDDHVEDVGEDVEDYKDTTGADKKDKIFFKKMNMK